MLAAKIEANDRIRETQHELGLAEDAKLPFLCECDDVACRELIMLTSGEYRAIRSVPARTVIAEGHPYSGRIVDRLGRCAIVEE